QVVDVRNPSRDGVLHRDQGELAVARLHRLEGLLEGGPGRGLIVREEVPAGLVAVGPRVALEGDLLGGAHGAPAAARAASRSAGVSTEIGALSTTAAQIESPSSSARSCSSFSRRSRGDGGEALKRSSAARR